MKVELRKSFRFEAAHHLPFAPEGHRCRHVHGHGYVVEVAIEGYLDPKRRWLLDSCQDRRVHGSQAGRILPPQPNDR